MNHLVDYFSDRYLEEQSRFDHIENKCSKFLTFVTVIIAGITALAGVGSGKVFHPESEFAWLGLVVFLFGSLAVICAWGHALTALRIGDCSVLPKSRETAEYLLEVDEKQAMEHIFNCHIDTLEKLQLEINLKSRNLELAYGELVISAWCLGISASIFVLLEIIK